jgi:N-sulfoglucosamine sulfohydrolase
VGEMLEVLESHQLKENTVIIFTSDNGMPFPRSKASLYAHGVRMPLVIAWDKKIEGMRVIKNPVNLIDLAPTILELARARVPDQMTGHSLVRLLLDEDVEIAQDPREFVVTAFEKHTHCRPNELGFPRRAIHTEDWTYIYNYEAERYPFGNYDIHIPNWDILGDIDPGPLKEFYKENRLDGEYGHYYDLAFGKVETEELYNHLEDPDMVQNLAYNPDYAEVKQKLQLWMEDYLVQNKDPRAEGKSPWDDYRLDK